MIFQDPMTSFNPVVTMERQITEPLKIHTNVSKKEAHNRAVELLTMTGIPNVEERINNYPYQFSGGMRQRAMIAMALMCSPKILIADEPTTALDVTIQAQIIDLVKQLREEISMTIIWITHDLGIIAGIAQRVLVMYAGYIVEEGSVKTIYSNPQHPYTIGLMSSLPKLTSDKKEKLVSIDGLPPVLLEKPTYCPFAPRCSFAFDRCWNEKPPLIEVGKKHKAACWVNPATGKERK
jgi:oligopeptide transport system ATP-binding protein